MARKKASVVVTGMNRDMAKSRFDGRFSFENRNIRISPRDGSCTSFVVTNERGTEKILDIKGTPVGVFSCNEYIGIFSYYQYNPVPDNYCDYITVYKNVGGTFEKFFEWSSAGANITQSDPLGFAELDTDERRIETVVSVEAENSIRVYWVDGIHEMRVIDFMRLKSLFPNLGTIGGHYVPADYFSYLPKVHKVDSYSCSCLPNGNFVGGTVQLCVTEVINGNESNVFWSSPLLYCRDFSTNLAHRPEATTGGDKVSLSLTFSRGAGEVPFDLVDFMRVYAIHRSSQDGAPVACVQDVELSSIKGTIINQTASLEVIMTGSEAAVDPAHILLLNRQNLKGIRSITDKDGLLFVGGMANASDGITERSIDGVEVECVYGKEKYISSDDFSGTNCVHDSQLAKNSFQIGHFKYKERYALGIQLMDSRGHWSDPIAIESDGSCLHQMSKPPKEGLLENKAIDILPSFKAKIDVSSFGDDVVAVRPVVAYLNYDQKYCLFQGFVTPTIFCEKERAEGQCYAKLSPFTRSMKQADDYASLRPSRVNPGRIIANDISNRVKELFSDIFFTESSNKPDRVKSTLGYQSSQTPTYESFSQEPKSVKDGTYPAWHHLSALGCTKDYNCELQTSWYYRDIALKSALIPYVDITGKIDNAGSSDTTDDTDLPFEPNNDDICTHDNAGYYVDANILTLHSPDITDITSVVSSSISIIAAARMKGFASDTSIVASTPKLVDYTKGHYGGEPGFQHIAIGSSISGGRCAMNLPNWIGSMINAYDYSYAQYWGVPPFGVDDYLNLEDGQYADAERVSSKLNYKQLSNYRYCDKTFYYSEDDGNRDYDCVIKATNGDVLKAEVVGDDKYIYKPSEDVVVVPSINSMWTNGPYYSRAIENDNFNTAEPLGLRPVNKFRCVGRNWQWSLYGAIWLRKEEDVDPFLFNYITPLSFRYNPGSGIDYNYWCNKGTIVGAGVYPVDDKSKNILGPKLAENSGKYEDCKFNWNGDDKDNAKEINLGNPDSGGQGSIWFDNDKDGARSYSVKFKYNSTPHAVVILKTSGSLPAPIHNYGSLVCDAINYISNNGKLYVSSGWKDGDSVVSVDKNIVNLDEWKRLAVPSPLDKYDDCLWVVDVINNASSPKFDKYTARWIVGGETTYVGTDNTVDIEWLQGDWYYQRWDCLRTYPKTIEDKNQVVEIVSVMVESRRNLDGRYDINGGYAFLQANPNNYGLINDSYTQENNFFSYTIPSENDNIVSSFPCKVSWSLPKNLNSNIDNWTQLCGLSSIDMDGTAGAITTLLKINNNIYCFQPSAISLIMYNNRTQVTAEDGMPVELAASKLVEGKYELTSKHGATSNLSVVATEKGVYFADEYNKEICAILQEVTSISDKLGFHSWAQSVQNFKFRTFFDSKASHVAFDIIGGDGSALCFNESYQQFESFTDIGGGILSVNSMGDTYSIHYVNGKYSIWRLGTGQYNKFYGEDKPYLIDCLISEGTTDKVFDNVEFSGDVIIDGNLAPKRCPFSLIRSYTEYQDSGWKPLDFKRYLPSNAKNLFRLWRTFVPRDGSFAKAGKIAERIRNPWVHVALKYDPALETDEERKNDKVEIQGIDVYYNEM